MSPKKISHSNPDAKPMINPSFSPLIKPKDDVKIIKRLGTIPANASPLKTVLCKIKHIKMNNVTVILRSKAILPF